VIVSLWIARINLIISTNIISLQQRFWKECRQVASNPAEIGHNLNAKVPSTLLNSSQTHIQPNPPCYHTFEYPTLS